jgi:hypothetical protein
VGAEWAGQGGFAAANGIWNKWHSFTFTDVEKDDASYCALVCVGRSARGAGSPQIDIPPFTDADNVILLELRIARNKRVGIKYHSGVLGLLKCHVYFAGLP